MREKKLCCDGHDLMRFVFIYCSLILFCGVFGNHVFSKYLLKSRLTPLIFKYIFKNIVYFSEISKVQKSFIKIVPLYTVSKKNLKYVLRLYFDFFLLSKRIQ